MNGVTKRRKRSARGFTLVALLSIIAIGTLVAGLLLPAMAKARAKSIQLKCSNNLRQLGVASRMYAQDEGDGRFPDCTGAVWPWDLAGRAGNALMRYGARREIFYCPGVPEQNSEELWTFTAGVDGTNGFRVIGYALAFKGAGRVRATNVTESLNPLPYRIGNTEAQPLPSTRVMSADGTLSIGSNEIDRTKNNYARVFGGSAKAHRSPHLMGKMPSGGNLVFLDGHTEWRPFQRMRVRTEADPSFWW